MLKRIKFWFIQTLFYKHRRICINHFFCVKIYYWYGYTKFYFKLIAIRILFTLTVYLRIVALHYWLSLARQTLNRHLKETAERWNLVLYKMLWSNVQCKIPKWGKNPRVPLNRLPLLVTFETSCIKDKLSTT